VVDIVGRKPRACLSFFDGCWSKPWGKDVSLGLLSPEALRSDPKISKLEFAARGHKDILGSDVTVNQSCGVKQSKGPEQRPRVDWLRGAVEIRTDLVFQWSRFDET
jgi:hypothetical protein